MTLKLFTYYIGNSPYIMHPYEQMDYPRCYVRIISIRICRFSPNSSIYIFSIYPFYFLSALYYLL